MKAVYKFNCDCGRAGSLEGVFVEEVKNVKNLIKSEIQVYFGEVLGKHSEVVGKIEKRDITFISRDVKVVEIIEGYDLESGFNPFNYETVEGENIYDKLKELFG